MPNTCNISWKIYEQILIARLKIAGNLFEREEISENELRAEIEEVKAITLCERGFPIR